MAAYVIVFAASVLTAGLTLYSGFGLGTLLLPVFALFFPVEAAVAATAVVHAANNAFKLAVVGRLAERDLVVRFGFPAMAAAVVGAALLGVLARFDTAFGYTVGPFTATVTPLKVCIALMMLVFALFELLPSLRGLRFDRRYLLVGGVLSGFFGGFSGHQGALRSAFLVKTGITTEAFVGTNAVIGFAVDVVRIATYAVAFAFMGGDIPFRSGEWPLLVVAIAAACAGVLLGKRYLHKVTMQAVQAVTGAFLLGIALLLGSGVL